MTAAKMLIGVGNPLGKDDGVGVYVAQLLQGEPGWIAVPAGPALENALGLAERLRPELLVIVDAADMGLPPGSFRRLSAETAPRILGSTHALPLDFALKLIREAAGEILLIGIQPRDLSLDEGLTPEVKEGAERLATLLSSGAWREIPRWGQPS